MIDANAYNITIRRGNFEGDVAFEARVRELPDLVEYGDTFSEAYELIIDSIETTAEVFESKGKDLPPPFVSQDNYSGRVTLRLPKSLHREIAVVSSDQGISLNQYLVNIISYYSGYAAGNFRRLDETFWRPMPTQGSVVKSQKFTPTVISSSDIERMVEWKKTG